ncbi:M17 family peptidase N-terminal domain-containing protein, partial [Lachnoclostridium sp.]|uniref:M17 family peptidase N-terminal domain-containing protein n=1 Tax=Lachnoclostridium sp. TaxID=2028282 RepID=UPI002897518F
MIVLKDIMNQTNTVEFILEGQIQEKQHPIPLKNFLKGTFLESFYLPQESSAVLYIGCGKEKELTLLGVKEIFAQIAKQCKEYYITTCSIDFSYFLEKFGEKAIIQAVLGLSLGNYSYRYLKNEDSFECQYEIGGLSNADSAQEYLREALDLAKGIQFARDMVNTPGNHLRPMDFNRTIKEYVEDIPVEVETLVYGQLKAMGMEGLFGIGGSSEYPPCLMILRYQGNPKDSEIYGLIGKGVTCDTGGYCLKSAKSMAGIKGDMAG